MAVEVDIHMYLIPTVTFRTTLCTTLCEAGTFQRRSFSIFRSSIPIKGYDTYRLYDLDTVEPLLTGTPQSLIYITHTFLWNRIVILHQK